MTTRLLPTFFAVAIMVLFSTTAFSQAVGSITVDFDPDASLELQQKTDIPPTFDADPQMWSQGTDLPGGGKKFHAVASYDGDIFTFGGVTVQGNQLFLDPTSYRYETGTGQWVPLANFPISNYQYGHAQAIGDKIYIFGGYEDNGNGQITTHPEMYIYDPNTNQFTVGASMLVTNTQIRGASVALDGKIYFIGGYTVATGAQFTTQVQIYDPAIDQWSLGQAYPIPVSFVSAAALDDKIIAVGGYNSTGAIGSVYYTANAYVGELDAGTLTWRQVADYPIGGIIHHSGVGINNVGYFFAGRPVIDNNPYAASYGFSFDGDTETWASMEKKPLAMRTAPQAGTDGTKIYSVGGERSGGFPVTTMEVYDPSIDLYFDPVVWRQIVVQTYNDGNLTPKSNEISIMNDGPADFEWTASVTDGSEWMSLSVTSGGGLGYFPEMTEVTVDPSGLSAGQTTGEITISTNDPATTELKIPVHVFITSEPVTVEQDVLIEEFSGTWCGWCPYGVDSLEALKDRHGDRINVLTYHSGTHDPFDTQPVSEILDYLGVTSYPSAAFNRSMPLEGQEQQNLSRGEWGAATRAILAGEGAPVNIEFTNKTFDENTGAVNVTVEATFLQAVPGDIRMQLIQTTNDRNVGQVEYYVENNQVRARLVYPYFHDHVVELILPDPVGEPLTNVGEEYIMPGTKITKDFSFTSIDSIPELSDLTVFVHEYIPGTPGKVFQSYSEQLWVDVTSIGGNPNPGHFALEQNYPNPFNPTTTIEYTVANRTDVRIVVTDMLGREVATIVDEAKTAGSYITTFDASGLESGTYYMTMQAGDFRDTRAMTLMK